ncbi:MAG TPA: WbuC family cupin fold metalloprotein [Verrucomicrobiae bacterium]|nr:WbuC family cupin fold metalloprotein [Verrucomicrobiae bacterium]
MRFKELNSEVLVVNGPLAVVGRADIDLLKKRAAGNPRRRIRICAHQENDNRIHEMLIVLAGDCYIRPHKHFNKSESLHLIEGSASAVFFDDAGAVTEVVPLGDYSSGHPFYYRLDTPRFHSLLIRSDFLVFHETTNGPFNRADTAFAPWSPEETDLAGRQQFMKSLTEAVRNP